MKVIICFVVAVLIPRVTLGEPCDNRCQWLEWNAWSDCSETCGTTELTYRTRALCCAVDWNYETCVSNCGLDGSDKRESKYCGNFCYNGGTFTDWQCDCSNRYFGKCCENRLSTCEPYPTDIIFLIDSSVSQTQEQFQKQLRFVESFIDEINIESEAFQVGVITFSTNSKVEIYPDDANSKEVLKNKIRQIPFRPGATYTHKALIDAAYIARGKQERRPGMATLTYAFVLTDGMSTDRQRTKQEATTLKNQQVHTIAIGVGKEVSHKELNTIASPGDSYSQSYVFSVDNFDALNTLIKRLVDITCPKCTTSYLSDIIFAVDGSVDRLTQTEFQNNLDTISYIVNSLQGLEQVDGQRVGLVMMDDALDGNALHLSNAFTKEKLLSFVQTLQMNQETCDKDYCVSKKTNISASLRHILDNNFNVTHGGRNEARKFLIVATSGRLSNIDDVKSEMETVFELTSATIFALGSGYDIDMTGLQAFVTDPSHVYVALDKDDMSNIDVLLSKFSYIKCSNAD